MIKGSCNCGGIKFELAAPPSMMATCHCTRCRKAGTGTSVFVKEDTFWWIEGEELVSEYHPLPPYTYTRKFCKRCGTSLGEPGAGEFFPLNAQCLDDDPQTRNQHHEFVAEKPDWYEICDNAKQFLIHPLEDE
mgnify:FL=1